MAGRIEYGNHAKELKIEVVIFGKKNAPKPHLSSPQWMTLEPELWSFFL